MWKSEAIIHLHETSLPSKDKMNYSRPLRVSSVSRRPVCEGTVPSYDRERLWNRPESDLVKVRRSDTPDLSDVVPPVQGSHPYLSLYLSSTNGRQWTGVFSFRVVTTVQNRQLPSVSGGLKSSILLSERATPWCFKNLLYTRIFVGIPGRSF